MIVVTAENLPEVIVDLERFMSELNDKDREFADSLINGKYGFHKRNGKLSSKQTHWIGVFINKALGFDPTPAVESVGSLSGLIDLFNTAKGHKKYPKITLEINGETLRLTLAGDKAKHPGTINITDGGSWGDNKFFGRVNKEGKWSPSKIVSEKQRETIARLLQSLAHDPQKVAMTFGKHTDHCCFCMKQLDTKESKHAGYGPVCAGKWGLPWGDTA